MKLSNLNSGDYFYIGMRVDSVYSVHVGRDNYSAQYQVAFDEGDAGPTIMSMHPSTTVIRALDLMQNAPPEKQRPLQLDDIVFIAFEDGMWRVADRFKDKLFLTPHGWDGEARLEDEQECYLINSRPKENYEADEPWWRSPENC
jgi:hypothetical protein